MKLGLGDKIFLIGESIKMYVHNDDDEDLLHTAEIMILI